MKPTDVTPRHDPVVISLAPRPLYAVPSTGVTFVANDEVQEYAYRVSFDLIRRAHDNNEIGVMLTSDSVVLQQLESVAVEGRGGDVDRNWLEENLWRTKQELNHGNRCVNIIEWLTGEPVDIKEVVRRYNRWTPDPSLPDMKEWVRLAEVFKEQEARQEPWARLINSQGLLEGGSRGLFYAASQLSGSELNDRLSEAFTVVLDDERGHGPANIYQIADAFTQQEAVDGARGLMVERGIQRLRMRNEQFSFPIDEARIQDIAAGNISLDVTKAIWGETLAKFID